MASFTSFTTKSAGYVKEFGVDPSKTPVLTKTDFQGGPAQENSQFPSRKNQSYLCMGGTQKSALKWSLKLNRVGHK